MLARAIEDAGKRGLPILLIFSVDSQAVKTKGVAALVHTLIKHCPRLTRESFLVRAATYATVALEKEMVAGMVYAAGFGHRLRIVS